MRKKVKKISRIIRQPDNKNTSYLIVKKKNGNTYCDIMKYKNNIFTRLFLSNKNCKGFGELYVVPEFKGVEGLYYKL